MQGGGRGGLGGGGSRGEGWRERKGEEINISPTWPLKPLPMTAGIVKRYGSREGEEMKKIRGEQLSK